MAVIENVTLAYIAMSIGVINVCLMMGLLNSYLKTYNEIKSGFIHWSYIFYIPYTHPEYFIHLIPGYSSNCTPSRLANI